MGDYHEFTDQYKVPVIAKLLHALPHYNITFHKINSTFRPNDEIYLEVSKLSLEISFNGESITNCYMFAKISSVKQMSFERMMYKVIRTLMYVFVFYTYLKDTIES